MKIIKIAFICLLPMILSSCWDRAELEEQAYVIAIGIDVGKIHDYIITYEIANPKIGAREIGQIPEQSRTEIVSYDVPELLSLRDLANASVARRISLAHTKVIVISEELARTDKFLKIIMPIIRDRDIRRNIAVLISKEDASEFIRHNDPKLELRTHKFYELMINRWKETGLVPYSTLNRFYKRTKSGDGLFLAGYATAKETTIETTGVHGLEDRYKAGQINKEGGNPTQIMGSAVFKNGKMIGSITGEETRFSVTLRPISKVQVMMSTFVDPLSDNDLIIAKVKKARNNKVKFDLSGERPKIDIKVFMEVEIVSIQSFIDYVENFENQAILEKALKKYFERGAKSLVEKTQRDFKGDPFMWFNYARQRFLTVQEYKAYNWMEKYPKADVNVEFDVTLIDFGKENRHPKIIDREEK